MNKIISFLREKNRCKRLILGLFIGLFALYPWTAIYSATVLASCLELKNKLRGSYWDWLDWILTILGGSIASLIYSVL